MVGLSALIRPDHGVGPHPHRSWLHLLALEPGFMPSERTLVAVRSALVEAGLAVPAPDGGLQPGPEFASVLGASASPAIPRLAGPIRGSVTVEAGIWRCYPDPGPQGFQSDPVTAYTAACPSCGGSLNFFLLRFPDPDPYQAVCPHCQGVISVLELHWSPELPKGRFEVTFGDLPTRASLLAHPVFSELQLIVGTPLREVHVTL